MGSKKQSRSIAPLSVGDLHRSELIGLLRESLAASQEREKELMRLLAEKDAQIRMVLEEKFFRPVVSAPAEVRRVPAVDAASLSDQAHDTRKGDEKELAAQDEALKKAQETLESELRALESEQEAAHAAPAEAEATSEAVPA